MWGADEKIHGPGCEHLHRDGRWRPLLHGQPGPGQAARDAPGQDDAAGRGEAVRAVVLITNVYRAGGRCPKI